MKPLSITAKRMLLPDVAAFCAFAYAFVVTSSSSGETGKIRIGIKFDQPGQCFKQNVPHAGYDVDVTKSLAKTIGYS